MTRLTIPSFVAAGAFALALAAPSLAASPSPWAKSADKICARANAESDRIPRPTTTKALIAGTRKILAIGKRQTSDLAKLKRPAGDARAIAQLIGYYEQQADIVESLIDALEDGDEARVKKLLEQGDEPDDKADSLVTKLGARRCAE